MHCSIHAITLATLCASGLLATEDWPQFRGPNADGRWNPPHLPDNVGNQEPSRLWSVKIGSGYGGVTVAGNRVVIMERHATPSERESVTCRHADTGELLWEHEWSVAYGKLPYGNGPRASVLLDTGGKRAFAFGATGVAACLDLETGSPIWQVDTVATFGATAPEWGFAASPVLISGSLILQIGAQPKGCVIALDPATGEERWRGGPDPAGYCTPTVIEHGGRRQMIVWGPEHVQSLEPQTGRLLWKHPYPITYGVSIAQPIYHEGKLLVSGYWHGTKCLELGPSPSDVSLAWENETEICGLMSAPLLRNNTVFMLDKNRGLQAFDLATGTFRWRDDNTLTRAGRNPQFSLVWMKESDGLAALLNAEGELVYLQLDKDAFTELGRHQLLGKTWSHPAFAGNRVFARSDEVLVAWKLW